MSVINHYLLLIGMLLFTAGFFYMLCLIKKATGKALKEKGKAKPAESGSLQQKPRIFTNFNRVN